MPVDKKYPEFAPVASLENSDMFQGFRSSNPDDTANIKYTPAQLATLMLSLMLPYKFVEDWNADTNTPTLSDGVGTTGNFYRVSVDGATSLDGIDEWNVDDFAWFDGTVWRRNSGSKGVVPGSEFVGFKARRTTTTGAVTGDGTVYTIVYESEDYDEGDNFVTDTFTAPVDGFYFFTLNWGITVPVPHTLLSVSIVLNGSPQVIYTEVVVAANTIARSGSIIGFLEAGQTVTSRITVSAGGFDIVVLAGTRLSGELWAGGVGTVQAKAPNEQTGLTYTFVPNDIFRIVNGTNAALQTYTMPNNSTAFFPDGGMITVSQGGVGQIEFVPDSGITLEYADPIGIPVPKTRTQHSSVTWVKRTSAIWTMLGGDITA